MTKEQGSTVPLARASSSVSVAASRKRRTSLLFQTWAETYGPVFQIPTAFRGRRTILLDLKAVNRFYSMERSVYVKGQTGTNGHWQSGERRFGRGLLWAEGDGHKRPVPLASETSNAAIRRLTHVFYDSAYKLKGSWDTTIDNAQNSALEHWRDDPCSADLVSSLDVHGSKSITLDSIGIAGFSHDSRILDGEYSAVAEAFGALSFERISVLSHVLFVLGTHFPFLAYLPLKRNRILRRLSRTMRTIADNLLEKTRREKMSQNTDEVSVIGLLLKAEDDDAELHMDSEEVLAQATKPLLATREAGRITRGAGSIWWRTPPGTSWSLGSRIWTRSFSKYCACTPPVTQTTREALVDDVIPLGVPGNTESGEAVNSLVATRGSILTVTIRCINGSEVFWGFNAKEFALERWLTLNDDPLRAKELHRHLLTFLDGPRVCLGKQFAIAEFKITPNLSFPLPAADVFASGRAVRAYQQLCIRVPWGTRDEDCEAPRPHSQAQGRGTAYHESAHAGSSS
ncbi:cytochrome P450 [Mycena crocata]|nr:cytochrome P450 [Mycena crocata]